MRSGLNPNRTAAARALRDSYADIVRKMADEGGTMKSMGRAIGRSHIFVKRVMEDNGIVLLSQREKPAEPVKLPDLSRQIITIQNVSYSSTVKAVSEISMPRPPWGEFDRDPRHETAPRGWTHMFSSPVTRAEQIERALWQEGIV